MFFLFSKVLWFVVAPVNFLLILTLAGLALLGRLPRLGRALAFAGFAVLLALAVLPIGAALDLPLEERFPPPAEDTPAPKGIIVLGGAIDDALSEARGQVALEEGAARLTEGVALSRRYPGALLFYSGGSGSLVATNPAEALYARRLWIELGVDPARIGIESRSRNTDENARFSAEILKPKPDETWLLVTSAYHMPRSMGLFRKAGFRVTAYPVDYHTFGQGRDWRPNSNAVYNLWLFGLALHEWIGLAAYYASGRIDVLFPGPAN